jgi:tripartite-type tricarboxylate transporter receptor subunit TctC
MSTRRAFLAAPAAALAAPAYAQAPAWPGRAVTMIVPYAAGGSNDVVARMLTPALEGKFRQPFVVENRAGGGGSVGMTMVARARPDGLTMLVSSASNHLFHPLASNEQPYDAREAFDGVSMLTDVPNVVAVHPSVPANNIQELIAWIRTQDRGVSYGSSGVGTSNHLAGELFRLRTGLEMTHVPYRGGGPAITDLIAGNVLLCFMNLPTVAPPAAAGRVRILAVCTQNRVALRQDLPTVTEQGVENYAVRSWTGLFAPRGTPKPVLEAMSATIREALETDAVKRRLADIASEAIWTDPAGTDSFVRQEYERWTPVVRAANIRLD